MDTDLKNTRREMYRIMRKLLEIEYEQRAFLQILTDLESAYEDTRYERTRQIINHTKESLKGMQLKTRKIISRMDRYLAEMKVTS